MLNGDWFCVVDVGKTPIPGTILVLNIQTQKKNENQHQVQGPEVVVTALPKRARRPMWVATIILCSKSSQREGAHLCQGDVGLYPTASWADWPPGADNLCMSGAGVGHLKPWLTITSRDSRMKPRSKWLIIPGSTKRSAADSFTTSTSVAWTSTNTTPLMRLLSTTICRLRLYSRYRPLEMP